MSINKQMDKWTVVYNIVYNGILISSKEEYTFDIYNMNKS